MLAKLQDTPERTQQELFLQTSLALSSSATQGYGSPEVEKAFNRARALCQGPSSDLQLSPVVWGLWRFYLIRSDLKAARELSQQLIEAARIGNDIALCVEAHFAAGVTFDNMGEFESARKHFELGLSLYDPDQRHTHLLLYGHDPTVVLRCFDAWALWSLGYPDLALSTVREAVAIAQGLHHPETLCYALFFAAWVHQLRLENEDTLTYARATIELAVKNGIAQWIAFGSSLEGWVLAQTGQTSEGIKRMRETLATYRAIGSEISRPHFLGLLAEALMKNGDTEEGLIALSEALNVAENTGQRYYESELHRLKGELLLAHSGNADEADQCFRHAIKVARRQKARSFEVRAASSLGRLWLKGSRKEKARRLLIAAYNSFTEGLETTDLRRARSLLEES